MKKKGKLLIVGFGPGSFEHITQRAREAIAESDVIIGYNTYVDLIRGLITNQEIVRTGMTEEVSRAQEAVRQAEQGKKVAVISSGDAGVYGMAGLVYEVLMEKGWREAEGPDVEVVPGISAIHSCAALLGAPIMHDSCTISLSDHLTPWEHIERRIRAAAAADFVIALYNPRSGRRTRQIMETQRILLEYRSPATPVGLVKSAYRERQHIVMTDLAHMLNYDIGMLTTVIIGNSTTFIYENRMITPRGYQRKYTLSSPEQKIRPNERLHPKYEPWALHAQPQNHKTANPNHPVPSAGASRDEPIFWAQQALEMVRHSNPAAPFPTASGPTTATVAATTVLPDTPFEPWMKSPARTQRPIFELAVSPGVANKKFTPAQMMAMASVTGEEGEIVYTPDHQILLRIPTDDPETAVGALQEVGLFLQPVGDVVQIKACDFCDGEKDEAIPIAYELVHSLGGTPVAKELKIGFNGCAMACYGATAEDIGVIYRRGKFDLFLGGKRTGRSAHLAEPVAEGIPPENIVSTIEAIIADYKQRAFPGERFHKFFKRVGETAGFVRTAQPAVSSSESVCGE
jgi:precorrin-3B C17-methyltransferase